MEDALTDIAPPSRFFEEDLNNFTPPSPHLPSPFVVFSNRNPNPNFSLLIIAISPASLTLLHHFSPKTLIGTLILPEFSFSANSITPSLRDKSCNIYTVNESPSTVIVSVQYTVSEERSHAVAKSLVEAVPADKVIILDSIQSRNFRGKLSIDESLAYKLETSKQRLDLTDRKGMNLDYLPSGSVIDGLGAAILARCQIRNIKGILCVTWPESGVSVMSLLKSLMKESGLDFVGDLGLDRFKDHRVDSELYT